MKKNKNKSLAIKRALAGAGVLVLSSCSLYSMFNGGGAEPLSNIDPVDPSLIDTDKDGIYQPKDGDLIPFSYRELYRSRGADTIPSKGNNKILVVPIEFSDYPFTNSFMSDLFACLKGTDVEALDYPSLASYYKQSSFGALNLDFQIAPIYKSGITAKKAYTRSLENGQSLGMENTDNGLFLVNAAVEKVKQYQDFNLKDFDTDGNGNLDGVIAVYSCPNSRNDSSLKAFDEVDYFWAYTFWGLQNPNKNAPTLNTYFWMSQDFLYKTGLEENGVKKLDSHTLIHEFGHMIGLDDYYVSPDCKYSDIASFNPLGLGDMMDGNILDHNAFSKGVMGWKTPKVVYDSCKVTLGKATETGDSFIIPSSRWNGTLFDEYFIVEFYTPDGLNKKDSEVQFSPKRPKGFTIPGIKIYHVDARIKAVDIRFNASGKIVEESYTYYNGYNIKNDSYGYSRRYFETAASNNIKSEKRAPVTFSLIHQIEGSGDNTFLKGGFISNESLFQEGSIFSLSYSAHPGKPTFGETFMPKHTAFNNGDPFPFELEVSSITENNAVISIKKADSSAQTKA